MNIMGMSVALCFLSLVTVYAAVDIEISTISNSGSEAEIDMKGSLIAIVYGDKNSIYCSVSADSGSTFSKPVEVGRLKGLLLGWRSGPQVAITEEYITILMTQRSDREIYAWRSGHDGKVWEGPYKVTDEKRTSLEGLCSVAALDNNSLFAVWVDMRHAPHSTVHSSISTDGGKTWSPSRLVYESPSGQICSCCQPTALYDGKEKVYVMWRNYIDGNRDMYYLVSDDKGKTFSDALKLGKGKWRLGACPTDGGGMATDSKGNIHTIWRRKDTLYTSLLEGPEKKFREGEQGRIGYGPEGFYITWQFRNSIYVLYPDSTRPVKIADGAHPSIAASPEGPVIITWEALDEGGGVRAALLKGSKEQ